VETKKNDDVNILLNITMLDLYNLYNELINRYNSKMNRENVIQREIPVDAYKIEDKMLYIKDRIQFNRYISFNDIMRSCNNKIEIVVTFLALLELIKLKNVRVVQEGNFSEIHLERVEDHEEV
jgi:segregation and condensation protein A